MRFRRRLLILGWFWAALFLAGGPACARTIRITVYHTNDVHGWIMPRPAGALGGNSKRLIGGMAALAQWVRRDPGPKLLLDAGDWFQGTPEGTLSGGESAAACLNALGYDAVEVGNHDFDLGQQKLQELIRHIAAPVLGANVYEAKTGARAGYLKPYVVKEVAGVKIGIFGLLTSRMPGLSFTRNIQGLEFRREADEARDMVRELKRQGATVIIALTHVGFEEPQMAPFEGDKLLASAVPGIDLIVGGHTHTLLERPIRDPSNGTLIVQAGRYLTHAGKATLDIDSRTGRVLRSEDRLETLWVDREGQARDVARIVARYDHEFGRKLDVVIGRSARAFDHNCHIPAESEMGDWATDCVRSWAGADLAFQNSCGIRSSLPEGPVTLRRIFEIMPFDNRVTTMTLTGAQVKEILEHGVGGGAGLIQVSGLSFHYRPDAASGRRVGEIRIAGRPLKPEGTYTVAAPDFLVRGGEGYSVFSEGSGQVETPALIRDVLAECVRKTSPLRAAVPDRILRE